MNKEQEAIFSLLKEIDKICSRNGIPYFLAPRLALHAIRGKNMPDSPFAGGVLMKAADMERFRVAAQEEMPEKRAVESMYNNKRFSGFYLRYEDTDTLCLRLNEGRNLQYPSLGVDIYPLRGKMKSRLGHLWNQQMETGWKQFCDGRSVKYSFRDRLCKIPVGIMFLGGRARVGRYLYRKLCKTQDVPDTKEYVVRLKQNTLYYPAAVFEKTKKASLEGYSFPVPQDMETYLKVWFGSGYEKKLEETYVPSMTVLTSARVGCEEFFREAGSADSLVKERNRLYRKDAKGRKRREYLDWAWEYVKMKGEGRTLGLKYGEKKSRILNLYKNGDYLRLDREMKEFGKMMNRYLENEEVFVPDAELLEIYLSLLEKTGKTKQQEKIEKYWIKEKEIY